MTESVLSIRSDRFATLGALFSLDGTLLAVHRELHPKTHAWATHLVVRANEIVDAFNRVCLALSKHPKASGGPAAIAIATPSDTALLIGSENRFLSPVVFNAGATLPRRCVPNDFSAPELARLYRESVVRQIGEREPDVGIGLQRVVSLGALLHRELSRHWVDNQASVPLSMPMDGHDYRDDGIEWRAVGIDRTTVPLLVPPSGVAAQVAPEVARRFGWKANTPIASTSDLAGCEAYGLKTGPAGWVVALGDGVRASFNGPPIGEEKTWLQMNGDGSVTTGTTRDAEGDEELSAMEACAHILRTLPQMSAAPGPRKSIARYTIATADGFIDHHAGLLFDAAEPTLIDAATQALVGRPTIQSVPLGTDGLRFVAGTNNGSLVGLRPGHTPAHLFRAVLEGLCLELRRWRLTSRMHSLDMPRLILRRPWTPDLAQLVVDACGEPMMLWTGEPELPALLGQALATIRDLELHDDASPTLTLQTVEPDPRRAELYATQAAVYGAVHEVLSPVLS